MENAGLYTGNEGPASAKLSPKPRLRRDKTALQAKKLNMSKPGNGGKRE
jgi:hypothetical protein